MLMTPVHNSFYFLMCYDTTATVYKREITAFKCNVILCCYLRKNEIVTIINDTIVFPLHVVDFQQYLHHDLMATLVAK